MTGNVFAARPVVGFVNKGSLFGTGCSFHAAVPHARSSAHKNPVCIFKKPVGKKVRSIDQTEIALFLAPGLAPANHRQTSRDTTYG
jgi:hypothetical protein